MTSATHFAFAYLVTSAAGANPQTALTSSIFSLVPDLDHPQSLLGRLFPGLSSYLLKKYGHRTVTHSLFAVFILATVLSPALLFSKVFYLSCLLAYSSHIFIDLFNRSGVRLLAPVSRKEYISFRTPELRILVASWKEYLILFIIVFLAFSVSGRAFSFSGAVRSVARMFYKNYSGALNDFQENSKYLCNASLTFFDQTSRQKVAYTLPVLTMFPEKLFLLKDNERLVLEKNDILNIEIKKTEKKVVVKGLSGSDPALLSSIPAGSFVSGKVLIHNYNTGIRSNDFINVKKGIDNVSLSLTCVKPRELSFLIYIRESVKDEINRLKNSLSSYQIESLKGKVFNIKRKIAILKSKGFYANYQRIIKLDNELKKINTKIEAVSLQSGSGSDAEVLRDIKRLEDGFRIEFWLWIYL